MLDISELLDDPDFVQSIIFEHGTHPNTCVQPASGNALQRLPEGERSKPSYQVFTKSNFPIKNGDIMFYKGEKYRCVTDENWSDYGYYDGIFQLYSGAQEINHGGFDPWL